MNIMMEGGARLRPSTADTTASSARALSARGTPAAAPAHSGSPSPWLPPGNGQYSAPRRAPVTVSSRRNRAVEHAHVFLEDTTKPASAPGNAFWLYGAFDYKMQCPPEQAKHAVTAIIDKLVDRMRRMAAADKPPPPPTMDATAAAALGLGAAPPVVQAPPPEPKANLVFDLVSTKKHISPDYTTGLPYKLGCDIYRYVDNTYGNTIITSFVGLTDNTARRVGRDVYYSRTDDLSRTHIPFTAIDSEHLFIVFPPPGLTAGSALAMMLSQEAALAQTAAQGRTASRDGRGSTAGSRRHGSPKLLGANSPLRSGPGYNPSAATSAMARHYQGPETPRGPRLVNGGGGGVLASGTTGSPAARPRPGTAGSYVSLSQHSAATGTQGTGRPGTADATGTTAALSPAPRERPAATPDLSLAYSPPGRAGAGGVGGSRLRSSQSPFSPVAMAHHRPSGVAGPQAGSGGINTALPPLKATTPRVAYPDPRPGLGPELSASHPAPAVRGPVLVRPGSSGPRPMQ